NFQHPVAHDRDRARLGEKRQKLRRRNLICGPFCCQPAAKVSVRILRPTSAAWYHVLAPVLILRPHLEQRCREEQNPDHSKYSERDQRHDQNRHDLPPPMRPCWPRLSHQSVITLTTNRDVRTRCGRGCPVRDSQPLFSRYFFAKRKLLQ